MATSAQQDILKSTTPTSSDSPLTVSDIYGNAQGGLRDYINQKYNFTLAPNPYQQQLINQQNQYANAIPELPASTMFPSAGNDILKGSYQGSVVGNIPIYAPSHLVPFGVFDARQRALQQAALQKQKDAADFYAAQKAPQTKRFAVQGELDDIYGEGLQKWIGNAKNQYGKDWATYLKQDPGFNNWNQSMQTMAQYESGIVDQVADLQKQIDSGRDVSPQTRAAMADFMRGVGGLDNPFDPKVQNLGQTVLNLKSYSDFDKTMNDWVDKVKQDVYESNPGISDEGAYDMLQTLTTTQTGIDKLKDMAANMYQTNWSGSDVITPDMVLNEMQARLGKQVKRSVQTVGTTGGTGADQKYDANVINPEGVDVTFSGPTQDQNYNVTTFDGQTFQKPINLNVPNQTDAIDASTGKPINLAGNSKVQIGKTFNVLVDADGKVEPNAQELLSSTGADLSKYHYATFAAGTIPAGTKTQTGIDRKTGQTTSTYTKQDQTVWIPVEGIKGGIATFDNAGNVVKGGRVDIQAKNAQQRTAQLQSKSTQQQPAQQQTSTQDDFDKQWAALPSGGTLVGPDGVTYKKQ